METGNQLFGNARGRYEFPDRKLVESKPWRDLVAALDADEYMYILNKGQWLDDLVILDAYGQWNFYNKEGQILFQAFPYYWGEDEKLQAKHNFVHKPGTPEELAIDWYKYPFRDAHMSRPASKTELKRIFEECAAIVKVAKGR